MGEKTMRKPNTFDPKGTIFLEEIRGGVLEIDDTVFINCFVFISSLGKITIGDHTIIGPHVTIVDYDHDMGLYEQDVKTSFGIPQEVRIGRYCFIGANSVILKGVTLGDRCIVGAGSVVTKSFPAKSKIAGNPAKALWMK
jgi:maltose O-acetyltransferase